MQWKSVEIKHETIPMFRTGQPETRLQVATVDHRGVVATVPEPVTHAEAFVTSGHVMFRLWNNADLVGLFTGAIVSPHWLTTPDRWV